MASSKKSKNSNKKSPPKPASKALQKYNHILKIFGNINRSLSDNRRLSAVEMRSIITSSIYPFYQNKPVKVREIQRKIMGILEQIPPKDICDVNLLPISSYAIVDWFAIDEHIERIMPDCIYVRVNAGSYGHTSIFNTRNYAYHKSTVRDIIDNLRELAEDNSTLEFVGMKKLKAGRPNDGTNENYFIDFILAINGRPIDQSTPISYKVTSKEGKKQARRVQDIMTQKMSKLKSEKKRISQAKKRTKENIEQLREITKAGRRYKSDAGKFAVSAVKSKIFAQARKLIDKDYDRGIITEAEYKKAIKKLYSNFQGGGEIK